MPETYQHTAGILDLAMTRDEPWTMALLVNRDLTGYTHSAAVVRASGIEIQMSVQCTPGVDESVVNFFLSDEQLTNIPRGLNRWYYTWAPPDGRERNVLKGNVRIEAAG